MDEAVIQYYRRLLRDEFPNSGGLELPSVFVEAVGERLLHCGNTGYVGRIGIYELMLINDDIRRLTIKKADSNTLKQAALKSILMS